jgi:MmyB-like transcription regulator ligand binding domain
VRVVFHSRAVEDAMRALDAILHQQEPFPAVLMNRHWDILQSNQASARFFRFLLGERAVMAPTNLLRRMFAGIGAVGALRSEGARDCFAGEGNSRRGCPIFREGVTRASCSTMHGPRGSQAPAFRAARAVLHGVGRTPDAVGGTSDGPRPARTKKRLP